MLFGSFIFLHGDGVQIPSSTLRNARRTNIHKTRFVRDH